MILSCQKYRLDLGGDTQVPFIFYTKVLLSKKPSILANRGGTSHLCFVDLKKAFDLASFQRRPLVNILCQNGLSGKLMNARVAIIYKSAVSVMC